MPCSVFIPRKGSAFTPAPERNASCCARMLPPPNVTRKAHSGSASGAPPAAIAAQPCVASKSPAQNPAAAPSEPAAEGEENFERREHVQVGQRLGEYKKERDEPAHAQYGHDAALYGGGEDAVRIGSRCGSPVWFVQCVGRHRIFLRVGKCRIFLSIGKRWFFLYSRCFSLFSPLCKVQCEIYAYDRKQVRGEQDRARRGAPEHGAAHAPDEEHGPRSGAEHAHAPRLFTRDRAAPVQVGDGAAADGVPREQAHEQAVRGTAGQSDFFCQRRKSVRKFLRRAELCQQSRQHKEGEEHGQYCLCPQRDALHARLCVARRGGEEQAEQKEERRGEQCRPHPAAVQSAADCRLICACRSACTC